MAVGFPAKTTYANGDVFSASDINDTNGTLNLTRTVGGLNRVVPTSVAVGSGSATVGTYGTVTFSGASSVSLNGVFSSGYENYRIVFAATCSVSDQLDLFSRVRASGTDASTANTYRFYVSRKTFANGNADQTSTGADTMQAGTISGLNKNYLTMEVSNPFNAINTTFLTYGTCRGTDTNPAGFAWVGGGMHTVNTSYDGITFYPNGETISGTISVYGYGS